MYSVIPSRARNLTIAMRAFFNSAKVDNTKILRCSEKVCDDMRDPSLRSG
jgi:hypothetical protein